MNRNSNGIPCPTEHAVPLGYDEWRKWMNSLYWSHRDAERSSYDQYKSAWIYKHGFRAWVNAFAPDAWEVYLKWVDAGRPIEGSALTVDAGR